MPEKISKRSVIIRKMKPAEIEIYQNHLNSRTKSGNDVVFVAVCNGKIVGLCKAGVMAAKKQGVILTVNVFDKKEGKGIGHKLIGKAHSYFEKQGIKKVITHPKPRVRKFYEKAGYSPANAGSKIVYARISPNARRRRK